MKSLSQIIWLVVSILTVITLLLTVGTRVLNEQQNNQIEITLNYKQMAELAQQSDQDVQWWLNELSEAGATSVAVLEESLIEFLETRFVDYWLSGDLKKDINIMATLPEVVRTDLLERDDYDLVITAEDEETYQRILMGLSRYDDLKIESFDAEMIIVVDRDHTQLLYVESNRLITSDGSEGPTYKNIVGVDILELGIGFDEKVIEKARNAHLNVLLRPINSSIFPSDMVENYIGEIQKYDNVVPLLLTVGSEVLGYKSSEVQYIDDIQTLVKDYGFTVGLLESNVQRSYAEKAGLDNLVANYDMSSFVRVFSVWEYIQERYIYPGYEHGEEIGNSLYRAITERNIRVIYFNPFMWNEFDYVTNVEDYHQVFQSLEDRLEAHGYSYGPFTVLEDMTLPLILRVLLYAEVMMAGLWLLNEGLYKLRTSWTLVLLVMTIPMALLADYSAPNFTVKVFGLLASIVYSTLAFVVFYKVFLVKETKANFLKGVVGLCTSIGIALLGGLMIGSIMARTDYMLEVQMFTGVKLSLLAPIAAGIVFVALEYIKEKTLEVEDHKLLHMWKELVELMRIPIRAGHLVILGMILAAGYIYLARTGHESGVQPMTIEIIFRNFLENILIARPRNKEFLIAFPVIVLGIVYRTAINRWFLEVKYILRLIVSGIGLLGFTSVTNTFSHIRSPLYLSSVRTLMALLFGVAVALVLYGFIKIGISLVSRMIAAYK